MNTSCTELSTPVVLLAFNRPAQTRRVFAEIRAARPRRLLIVVDGPRPGRPSDVDACAAVRDVLQQVDWECDVVRDYAERNMGCKQRVISGLNHAFERFEEAIILEDDCLPHPTFFRYCSELLDRYRNDSRVMTITANNLGTKGVGGDYSYHFSVRNQVWGWATWRRAWRHFDPELRLWNQLRETPWLNELLTDDAEVANWRSTFDRATRSDFDVWDVHWAFAWWAQHGLAIHPSVNLVTNIGWGDEATHTTDAAHPLGCLPVQGMEFPVRHPPHMIPSPDARPKSKRDLQTSALEFVSKLKRRACRVW